MTRRTTSRTGGARVTSVSRALRVLGAFAGHPDGVALTGLSAELGYGKASLSKILTTMEREKFMRRDPFSAHFRLSHHIASLVRRAAAALEAVWAHDGTARDFGLGVRPPNGSGRAHGAQGER